jgi:hypothetical protein
MAHRSLQAVTKVYYKSMSCFATVSWQIAPLVVLRFPIHSGPFCTMWFRQFTQNVTKTNHKDRSHSHSTDHDTQPIGYLISKRVIPYRTRGDSYCPGVSTPMTRSLIDSSMTNHITCRIPTVSTIPNLPQNHNIEPHHGHLTSRQMEDQHSQHLTEVNLNIIKMERLVRRLKTAGLSNTTNHKNPFLIYEGLGNQLMHAACIY